MTVSRILLVRHGQSEWNAAGRWQGRADVPLTDLGRRQAHAAAAAIGLVDVIVASPLRRAWDTAEIIAEVLGLGPVQMEAGLAERDVGEWTGLTRLEIDERWPGAVTEWRLPPGFEPDDLLLSRVGHALAQIAARSRGGTALAVTHGGVMFALARHHERETVRIPNLGAQWVQVDADGGLRFGEHVPLLAEPPPPSGADAAEQVADSTS